jgi:hypothetical protein
MTVETFSISDFVDYLRKVGIDPALIMIEKYGDVFILDKQAIALYYTTTITFECNVSASQPRETIEKARRGIYIAYRNGDVVMPCKLTVDTDCIDLIAKGMDEITNWNLISYRSSLLYSDKWCQHLVIFRGLRILTERQSQQK